jgi:cation diffusion facilitator CzcD-associated flavoprotein CzcO
MSNDFFLAIIGTGPIGLECGLQAHQRGYDFIQFESGDDIAHHLHQWSHVRLFTPLNMNMSSLGSANLTLDDVHDQYLTGGEYIERYLRPLSRPFQSNIRLSHRVISIGRFNANRFVILVENRLTGEDTYFYADYVIDASGTYSSPNYIGAGHLPAINERQLRSTLPNIITPLIPNVKHASLANKRILLIGKGHSAATSVLALSANEHVNLCCIDCPFSVV